MNGLDRDMEMPQPPDEPKEQGELRSKELLGALFGKYIDADTERREILQRLQDESTAYKDAMRRTQEAWNDYDAEQKRQAPNSRDQRPGDQNA